MCPVVCDGLKGLPDAIGTIRPQAITRTCVVHLMRVGFRYATRRDRDKVPEALKPVCAAPTQDAVQERFRQFDVEIRRVVRTTNAIESVNARIHKAVRARGHSSDEQAALKCVSTAVMSLGPTGQGRNRGTMRWKPALQAFAIAFDGRLSIVRRGLTRHRIHQPLDTPPPWVRARSAERTAPSPGPPRPDPFGSPP
ncbi:hypothetical protein Kpho02_37210 [Kitasatospora phosalacinea]|uniref:Mutator family transposase n=1 Tax=Kitasatospora phosalacinea TaxID=2065 RepID=A0A9W6Q7H4_9ACTN|nr:hypothetical protein Kpho02_37210 [Kitasatospora phosalacinea]